MGFKFNPFTGTLDWVSAAAASADISGGLDNLLLEDGSMLLLESGTEDVLLLE